MRNSMQSIGVNSTDGILSMCKYMKYSSKDRCSPPQHFLKVASLTKQPLFELQQYLMKPHLFENLQ